MVFEGCIEKGMVVLGAPVPLPDGTPVRVEPIAPSGFWRSLSLKELAEQQQVLGPATFDDLLGGWPVEEQDDDFDEAVARWRRQEREEST